MLFLFSVILFRMLPLKFYSPICYECTIPVFLLRDYKPFFFFSIKVLTKDSVTVSVDAVVYYRVSNATVSVANVENAHHSTRLLAQTTLRNILGTKNLHEILSDRESISGSMQVCLIYYDYLTTHLFCNSVLRSIHFLFISFLRFI